MLMLCLSTIDGVFALESVLLYWNRWSIAAVSFHILFVQMQTEVLHHL
jgi:hypothetical protein